MRHVLDIALLCTALSCVAVSATAQLASSADFNSFDAGTPLSGSSIDLPGDPAGDWLYSSPVAGAIQVVASAGGLDDKPLQISHQATSSGSPKCWFYLDPAYSDARSFRIRWTSVALDVQVATGITLRDGGTFLGSLDYRGSSKLTFGGAQNFLTATFQFGVPQSFELVIDMDADETKLFIDGVEVSIAQINYNDTMGLERIGFEMSGTIPQNFLLDDFEVLLGTGQVSTEQTSWGGVKALFEN